MWIFTTAGYWSAVQDRNDPTLLSVRTRDRVSADALADGIELIAGVDRPAVRTGEGTDYPYRLTVTKIDFAAYLSHEVLNYLTYTNFKDEARRSLGDDWAHTLGNVWYDTWTLTDEEGVEFSPYMQRNLSKGYRR